MYHALYRKWRPMTFDDVVSQDHITTTLKNQIKNNKIAHAYLFTGSRGTGKTTCARIFAKTINCLNPVDANPCLECEICRNADSEALTDIIEIDAASNTGVDDIRNLKESTEYLPEQCRYKVYIIDEVHMLSMNAFNAFLKVMEEPPAHVVFILATTEVHKVPATIISRCQRFDFRRIRTKDIVNRLLYIASKEGISLDAGGAELIARVSDGGMRDALSILDQCIAYSDNVTLETVSDAVGIAGRDYLFTIIEAIFENDISRVLSTVSSLYDMSKDIQRLCDEVLEQLRNLMLLKAVPENDMITCLPDEYERLRALTEKTTMETILSKIEILQECSENMIKAVSKRIEFEMCMVKLCSGSPFKSQPVPRSVIEPNNQLTNKERQDFTARDAEASPEAPKEESRPAGSAETHQKAEPDGQTFSVLDCWNEIVSRLQNDDPISSSFLVGSKAYVRDNTMLIEAQNPLFLKMFKDHAVAISRTVTDYLGKKFVIKVRASRGRPPADSDENSENLKKSSDPVSDLISKAKQMNIDVEIK